MWLYAIIFCRHLFHESSYVKETVKRCTGNTAIHNTYQTASQSCSAMKAPTKANEVLMRRRAPNPTLIIISQKITHTIISCELYDRPRWPLQTHSKNSSCKNLQINSWISNEFKCNLLCIVGCYLFSSLSHMRKYLLWTGNLFWQHRASNIMWTLEQKSCR